MTVVRLISIGFGIVLALLVALGLASWIGVNGIVDNGMEVIGGNKLDSQLAQKEVDHLIWSGKVNALITDDKVSKLDVQLDWRKCGFGEWYYGEGRRKAEETVPALRGLLAQIEKPHQELHQSARKVEKAFKHPHPGLALSLHSRLNDHHRWISRINEFLVEEASGLSHYQNLLDNAVGMAWSTIKGLDNPAMGTESLRQAEATKAVSVFRYGRKQTDYVFILDDRYRMIAHPDPKLVGRDMSDQTDYKGDRIFEQMVRLAKTDGEGFLVYYWPEIGSETAVPKLTYLKYYQPWGWVVGSGVYLNEKDPALMKRVQDWMEGKPFSLGVQTDPKKCRLGEFLSLPETIHIKETFPEFKEAMDALEKPHIIMHESARKIEEAINGADMQGALEVFETETLPALEQVQDQIQKAITAEEVLEKGYKEAGRIYTTETLTHLQEVRRLLEGIRKEARAHIMSDDLMIQSSQNTRWTIMIVGIIALVFGCLSAWFISRKLVGKMGKIADEIGDNSEQVAEASSQVAQAGQSLAEGASEQAAALEETSSSMEELSTMTRQNADNASQANVLMTRASATIGQAEGSMREMTSAMSDISISGTEISKITKTIDEIAFQTNLLALNAAVEAARAGDAGAGFAVVADEVRNLAQRAAEAAKHIAELIEGTISKIDQGNNLVQGAAESFAEVAEAAKKVADLVGEIAAASREQAQGIDQVNQAVSELDQVTQRNAANAEESASASEQLNAQAESMRILVGQLLALVGRAQTAMTASSRGKRPPVRSGALPYKGTPAAKPRVGNKEMKAHDIIPMDDDFDDF